MLRAIRLRTAYLQDPLGIDIAQPELSWNLEGDGETQTAYEIRAAGSEQDLALGKTVWESGVVKSNSMLHHAYEGTLHSRERVYWRVRISDDKGELGPWSDVTSFEMGLLAVSDWQAQWITGDYLPKEKTRYPADYFRKIFAVSNVACARLYISACGVYEATLNGRRVGNQIMTPGLTSYDVRVQYQTFDVADYLTDGDNQLEIVLGDGWYRGCLGVEQSTNVYGSRTAVIAQLEWTDQSGKCHVVVTGENTTWSNDGPIGANDPMLGERVDANRVPSYGGNAQVIAVDAKLSCSNNVPVTEHERLHPTVLHTPDGNTVLDFGQNLAGYVEFTLTAHVGDKVCLTMGERLDAQGNFTLDNILQRLAFGEDDRDFTQFQKIEYICKERYNRYKPKICVQGFRYVLLQGWPCEPKLSDFTAIAVYSDLEECMSFTCSYDDMNNIVRNTLWSMKSNFLDVPTDCPTRERAAWTGDAQIFFNTGTYFMDTAAFCRKWIQDMFDDQAPDGKVYNIVPRCAGHSGINAMVEGSAGWTDAGILIPYRYWKLYGDTEILQRFYPQMKRLAEYLLSRRGVDVPGLGEHLAPGPLRRFMVTGGFNFGEWTEPDVDVVNSVSDTFEEATAYLIYTLRCMAEIARATGHEEDAQAYLDRADESQQAYWHYYLPDGEIHSSRMCKYVRPLALGILDGNARAKRRAQEDLVSLVRDNRFHVGTGFLSTPFLPGELCRAGDVEAAYKVLLNEEYPGWIYEIRQGATTIWENWC